LDCLFRIFDMTATCRSALPVRYGNIPVINFHKIWCNLW